MLFLASLFTGGLAAPVVLPTPASVALIQAAVSEQKLPSKGRETPLGDETRSAGARGEERDEERQSRAERGAGRAGGGPGLKTRRLWGPKKCIKAEKRK